MSFDHPPDNPGYPCSCGGSIEPGSIHYVAGFRGDPPDPCCQKWECDKCGDSFYEHDRMAEMQDLRAVAEEFRQMMERRDSRNV